MSIHPYLHFEGTCSEAMRYYNEVFGGTNLQIMLNSEAPPEAEIPGNNEVMHSQLDFCGGTLMASDFAGGVGDPQKAVSVTVMVKSADEGKGYYDKLGEKGDVIMPYGPMFFSSGFGMMRDKFGTHWMFMTDDS